MDLSTLRKMRNSSNSIKEIQEVISKQNNSGSKNQKDDRFWSAERDATGNGSAVIRFLPKHDRDELPWVRVFQHSFKNPANGKWYIENSLSTIDEKDPVGELNQKLWNSGIEANKEIVRKQKRKLSYICNILVIKDSAHPENEGQVKLFKFGKKIHDMIVDKVNPTFDDEEPVDVFNVWAGADFKLRIREVEGYANYDKSEFAPPSELMGGDEEKILEVCNKQHWLGEFIAPDKFKSYNELQKRLDEVLNSGRASSSAQEDALDEKPAPEPKKVAQKPEPAVVEKKVKKVVEDDDEDEMSYFKKIAATKDEDIPF